MPSVSSCSCVGRPHISFMHHRSNVWRRYPSIRSNGFPPSEWRLTQRAEPCSPQTGPESRSTLYFVIPPVIYLELGCYLLQPSILMSVSSSIMCNFDFVTHHRLFVATSSVPSNGDWSRLWSVTHIQHSGFDPGFTSIKVKRVVSSARPSFRLFFSLFPRQIPHMYSLDAFIHINIFGIVTNASTVHHPSIHRIVVDKWSSTRPCWDSISRRSTRSEHDRKNVSMDQQSRVAERWLSLCYEI